MDKILCHYCGGFGIDKGTVYFRDATPPVCRKCGGSGLLEPIDKGGDVKRYVCLSCTRRTATLPFHDCDSCVESKSKKLEGPLWDEQSASSIIGASKNNKYKRKVKGVEIDVYDVLRAFDVTCPAIQHAVKKLLAPGQRGHKDRITDLREALASVQRGIEMEEGK